MIPAPPQLRSAARLANLALLLCTVLSLANLPAEDLPPGWLLAFTMPAALLGLLRHRWLGPWRRAALAVALQTTACFMALAWADPLSRPAALACTILPPMAFVAARRRDADGALGLFLSFCVLLVGVILDGVDTALVAAYGAAACLALRSEVHLAARLAAHGSRARTPLPANAPALLGSAALVAVPCLLAAFALERTLALLPSPSGSGSAASSGSVADDRGRRGLGLGDSFVLDGGSGVLADLHGEELVCVRAEVGRQVPDDLYLRSGFFAVPGLDRWQLGMLDRTEAPSADAHLLRRPLPQAPVRWLEVERFAGARNFVFVPPGTCEVRGVPGLVVDPTREWLRQDERRAQTMYLVGYQDLPRPPLDLPTDPRARGLGLLALPASLDRAPFDQLLDRWQVQGPPLQCADRIAAGLAQLCRYDRQEPTGPYAHALQNFLFAEQDRRGYCMHFASAAALLLRMRGVPCRIGVGLYGGTADPREDGARIYGSQHAHAWVEIPFAGRGYAVFDPTPPAERGQRMPSTHDPATAAEPDAAPASASLEEAMQGVVDFLTQPWLLMLALLLAVASTLWPAGSARPAPTTTPPSAKTARRLLVRILRELAEAGHLRSRGQTLESFARDLAARDRLAPEVRAAFATYQEVRFGGRRFDAEREQRMARAIAVVAGMERPGERTPAD